MLDESHNVNLLCATNFTLRLKFLHFKTVIRPALVRYFYNNLKTDFYGRASQALRYLFMRGTLNFSTVYQTTHQFFLLHASELATIGAVRAPTRTCWHRSRIIDITRLHTTYIDNGIHTFTTISTTI